jgi:hypothetical protein
MPKVLLTLTVNQANLNRGGDIGFPLVSKETLLRKTNQLLHYVNAAMYGRQYERYKRGLTGFGCIEKQLNEQPHIHLAITSHTSPQMYAKLKKVIYKKVEKIAIFDNHGVDIRPITQTDTDYLRVGEYLAKDGDMIFLDYTGVY